MKKMLTLTYAISLALIIDSSVIAQESVTNFGAKNPTADDFTNALVPAAGILGIKTRSIRPLGAAVKKIAAAPVAANLTLTFEFDSATLTRSAKTTLDSLGSALQGTKLSAYAFRIEGHTDALGEARYNSNLSRRRADAVKNYLAGNYSVSTSRLKTVGKGETELFDPKHPGSSSNRRVKIVNIGLIK